MIEVMLFHVTEIGIAKTVEVRRMMNPLLGDIRLESEGNDNRRGVGWKKQNTQRHEEKEEGQQVAHAPAHVFAVKRLFVMAEMSRVEILVRHARPESLVAPLRNFPMPVQDKAMRKIFRQHPGHDAEGNKSERPQEMT